MPWVLEITILFVLNECYFDAVQLDFYVSYFEDRDAVQLDFYVAYFEDKETVQLDSYLSYFEDKNPSKSIL